MLVSPPPNLGGPSTATIIVLEGSPKQQHYNICVNNSNILLYVMYMYICIYIDTIAVTVVVV